MGDDFDGICEECEERDAVALAEIDGVELHVCAPCLGWWQNHGIPAQGPTSGHAPIAHPGRQDTP
jgi:hypothetical protein